MNRIPLALAAIISSFVCAHAQMDDFACPSGWTMVVTADLLKPAIVQNSSRDFPWSGFAIDSMNDNVLQCAKDMRHPNKITTTTTTVCSSSDGRSWVSPEGYTCSYKDAPQQ